MNINGYPLDYYGNEFKHFFARVENVYDNDVKGGKAQTNQVQIRIFGQQDMDFEIKDLPWAFVAMPTTTGSATGAGAIHGLQHADLVIGFWLDAEMQMPCVTGVIVGGPTAQPDELYEAPPAGSSSPPSSSSSSSSSSSPSTPAPRPSKPATNPEPNVVSSSSDESSDYTDQGVQGASDDTSVPATLRHNNPLGINTSAGAAAYDPRGSAVIGGGNQIASFDSTIDGYGYGIGQMALNAKRNSQVDSNGRLYTTPQLVGDQWATPGYDGAVLVGSLGNNNRLYFDSWSNGWNSLLTEMENRETDPTLRNKTKKNNDDIPSGYDWGQNAKNKEAGFNKMRSVRGI